MRVLAITIVLAGYGVYAAGLALPLLIGATMPALLICFVLQTVCAFAAAFGVWRGARWAAGAVVFLGISIAGTWLFEAFILGLVAYLHALLVAALAVIVTLIIAATLDRRSSIV
jgi:hypothetical protein